MLRQIALLYVMAQIGSFVPAEYASFRIVGAILSRLSNDDSIEASMSTFSKEMSTMAFLISAMRSYDQSLVLVDELGRGTSPEEGIGIAHALAENIIKTKVQLPSFKLVARCLILNSRPSASLPLTSRYLFFRIRERNGGKRSFEQELTMTLGRYPNVVCLHLETDVRIPIPLFTCSLIMARSRLTVTPRILRSSFIIERLMGLPKRSITVRTRSFVIAL